MRSIQIADRWIGSGHPCFIIAEAGVNHNGDVNLAKHLIDIAAEAGADAVKFQTFHAEDLVTNSAEKAEYQKVTTGSKESQLDMLKKLELSDESFFELSDYAKTKRIIFLSTPFDEKSADLLDRIGIPAYKISSGEITNFPLLIKIAGKQKPIILSTGMSTLGEVEEAMFCLRENGSDDIVLLHCTTSYPAPMNSVNLRAMETLRVAFRVPVGYSDHTKGITIPIAAVSMGANVIEKHVTLDRTMTGPDHSASIEPGELSMMIHAVRDIEKARGNGVKIPDSNENKIKQVIRKSIVARREISIGEVIRETDLIIKRPGTGIHPRFFNLIAYKTAIKPIRKDQMISWDMIG